MRLGSAFDVAFQSSLPLPLARLYTRAHHAKGERERHDHAFHLVEAALKLGAAALVARYLETGQRSEKVEATLQHLARASLGHWVAIFREALGWLAAEKDPWARRILDHLEPIVVRAGEVHLLLSKPVQGDGDKARVSLLDLLDLLPAYRNAMSDAHGSIKSDPTMYRENTPALLELARLLLAQNALLGGGRLVYAEDVRMGFRGEKRVVWMALAGLAAIRCQPYEGEVSAEAILPGRLYWEITAGEHIPLCPLLHYRSGEVLDQVFFLNRARNDAQGIQFLCYTTGEFYVPAADSEGMRLVRQLSEMLSSLPPRHGNGGEADGSAEEDGESKPGRRFGDFDIEERIGQGGMGVVYHAQQRSLDRPVALKFLPQAMEDDPVALARFKQEVRALARCDHPNVVKVLSAGQVNGTHHYAMEFISGCDLSSIATELESLQSAAREPLEERAFDLAASSALRRCPAAPDCPPVPPMAEGNEGRERGSRPLAYRVAEVMRDAARGVQHIHDQGIIHRDLKPQNIMITGLEHRPVIMDLGLAKLIGASRCLTRSGKSPGTTRYMPPEQLQHNLLEVDARADVYALGAVTYELVCHRPMIDGDTEERLTAQILFEEPPPPQRANPAVPADLAIIIAKATRKDPRERYPSAAALANDLDSFVHGRPIVARPPSAGYLLKLFLLNNPALVTAAAAAAIVIVGLVTGWVASLRRAWHDERQATLEKVEALKRLRGLYLSAEAKRLSESCPDLASILAVEGALHERTPLSNNALMAVLENLHQIRALVGHTRELSSAAFDRTGQRVVTASWDCTARVWDAETGTELAVLEGHNDRVSWATFSPDGKRVATASLDGTARVWDLETRAEPLVLEGHANKVVKVCFSVEGGRVATASWDHTARVWDSRTGETIAVLGDHQDRVNGCSLSPDGRLAATASSDGTAGIWDASSGQGIRMLAGEDDPGSAAIHRGRRLAEVGKLEEARRELEKGAALRPGDAEARYGLGYVLYREGKLEESRGLFEHALSLDPGHGRALEKLGIVQARLGDLAAAERSFAALAARDPRDPVIRKSHGATLRDLGRHREARLELERALELAPEYPDAYHALALLESKLGRSDEALQLHQIAVDLEPGHTGALNQAGVILGRAGRTHEAARYFRAAVAARPDHVIARLNLARAHARLRRHDLAIPDLERVLVLEPGRAEALDLLARCFEATGEPRKAARAREARPGSPGAERENRDSR